MRESGRTTKLMGKESIRMWTGQGMRETGLKTNNMGWESRSGLMVLRMRVSISRGRNMGMESSLGQMGALSLGNSMTTIFMEEGFTSGLMEESSMESGRIIRWRGTGLSHGQMGESMWGSTSMI